MKKASFQKMVSVHLLGLILPFSLFTQSLYFKEAFVDSLILRYEKPDSVLALIDRADNMVFHSPDSVREFGKIILQILSSHQQDTLIPRTYDLLGKANDILGDKDSAKYWFTQSLNTRRTIGDATQMALSYFNLGLLMKRSGNLEMTISYYLQGIDILIGAGITSNSILGKLYGSLGNVYMDLKQPNKAFEMARKSLSIRQEIQDSIGIASSLVNLGNIHAELGNHTLAKEKYLKALPIYTQFNFYPGIITAKKNLANSYHELGRNNEALNQYLALLDVVEGKGDFSYLASIHYNIGFILNIEEKYSEALTHLAIGLKLLKEKEPPDLLSSIHTSISVACFQLGKYEEAYLSFEKAIALKDSIIQDKINAMETETQHRIEINQQAHQLQLEKEKALAQKTQLELIYRNLLTGIIAGILLLLLGVGWLFARVRARRKRAAIESHIDRLIKEQEQMMFDAMIQGQEQAYSQIAKELHDNIGMLLSATNLHFSNLEEKLDSHIDSFQQAKSTLLMAVKEVRNLSREMLSGTLDHVGLIEALKKLLDVMKQSGHYQVNMDISDLQELEIPPSIAHSLYRCVQELLSNVIRHAQASEISLTLIGELDKLSLAFKDNGVGCNPEDLKKGEGMGMKSIASRVEEMEGVMSVESQSNHGTKVLITIPLPRSKSEWISQKSQT